MIFSRHQEGNVEKADTIFHVALRMAQDMNHQNAISYIYTLMANMAFEQVVVLFFNYPPIML